MRRNDREARVFCLRVPEKDENMKPREQEKMTLKISFAACPRFACLLSYSPKNSQLENLRSCRAPMEVSAATLVCRILGFLLFAVLLGCSPKHPQSVEQRSEAAKALFERTTKNFHIPSAEAKGAEKERLQAQAAGGYEELLKHYPEQDYWASQALRSLANIRAAEGNLPGAVKYYAAVEKKYPQQRWEVLMSWKSAADLLWDAGKRDEAKAFYEKVVAQFDNLESSQVEKTIVRGSKTRLGEGPLSAVR